jgi:hypothetical protein
MGWWTDPVGSKPGRAKGPKKKDNSPRVENADKCPICRKRYGTCAHTATKTTAVKAKVQVTDKNGKKRTVTKNTGVNVDARGIQWCGTCNCRVMNNQCTNITCSTRK